jgi:hypothetical protein
MRSFPDCFLERDIPAAREIQQKQKGKSRLQGEP